MMNALAKLHRLLLKTETLLLATLLLSLIVIAVTQVLMRNALGGGLLWADAYTRISVLWIALFGAMSGARSGNHIAIDALLRYLPGNWRQTIKRINNGLTGLACLAAAWFSTTFVAQEYDYGGTAFADIPAWWCEAIIPFAFAVIALRYSIAVFLTENQSNQTDDIVS